MVRGPQGRVRTRLRRKSPGRDARATVHGNRVRIRILAHGLDHAPRVMGFVHNPDVDPRRLFDLARDTLKASA